LPETGPIGSIDRPDNRKPRLIRRLWPLRWTACRGGG